jgi:N,N'-diacetyllegionaminate synthase
MKCYIIAEVGVNHNGSEEMAIKLIDAAVSAGADAVKFQTFKAELLVQKGTDKAEYQKKQTGSGDQFSMLKKLELSDDAHLRLSQYCKHKSIDFLSTGFDSNSIDMLLNLGMQRLKVPSGELTNKPYIDYVVEKNIPIILSTGMADMHEVREAVSWIKSHRNKLEFRDPLANMLTILHCTSSYPAPLESVNLKAMQSIADALKLPVGYSDHTAGILIPPVAVAMGAKVIEKHITMDRNLEGPDHQASIEPKELSQMVQNIRNVEVSLGDGVKAPDALELDTRKVVRRSVTLSKNVKKGEYLTINNLTLLRSEGEIPPKYLENIIGKTATHDLEAGGSLMWADVTTR